MTIPELASFCKERLQATWGVNQDGGGSSTLWLDGGVINQPSGGDERRVANSLMIVSTEPLQRSDTFQHGELVRSLYATNLHLGPGTNYPAITSVAGGAEGRVMPNLAGLNGVLAKGTYWWKIRFGGTEGWVDEAALESIDHSSSPFSAITPAFFTFPGP